MTQPKDSTISSMMSEYDNVPRIGNSRRKFDPSCELQSSSDKQIEIKSYEPIRKKNSFRNPPKRFKFPIEEEESDDERKIVDDFYSQNITSIATLDYRNPPSRMTRPSESSTLSTTMGRTPSIFFYFLVFLAEILLFGVLILSLVWVQYYHDGFAWRDDVIKQFNLHPVLMITGFIFLMGHAMLVYRLFGCCNKLAAKLLHTILYLMAIPCIVVAMLAIFDNHNLRENPIPNLYSLHSWMGLVTIGLFALQFVMGFFSFWMLMMCEQSTASFRAGLLPVHSSIGLITFMLAVATCCTGLTEKAFFALKDPHYSTLPDEAYYYNAMAMALVAIAIIMGYLLHNPKYYTPSPVAFVEAPTSNSHYVMTQHGYVYREKNV